jgi:hypothetical protein
MKKNTNVFVLTTEYHFLLSMSIVNDRYSTMASRNVLIFTGERLSAIVVKNLPLNVEVSEINVLEEGKLAQKIHKDILLPGLVNLFVFTAYRDLETYLLTRCDSSVRRHLVQDGANFYFKVSKSVIISRLKETLKIYRNLWRKGIFLKRLVLYKKHMAQCGFIDDVWVTNPELYLQPRFSRKPVVKINLLSNEKCVSECCRYFGMDEPMTYHNTLIYLSTRLAREDDILPEIAQVKSIANTFGNYKLLVKLHPGSPEIQVKLFEAAFKDCVVKNFIPAELYIANATNSYIVGGVTASLYFNNPNCTYFTLISVYQQLGLFPDWIAVNFPDHVRTIGNRNEA